MDGRTHRFLAINVSIIVISLLSAFYTEGFRLIFVEIGLVLFSAIYYSKASEYRNVQKKIGKGSVSDIKEEIEEINAKYRKNEMIAWALLLSNAVLTGMTAEFLPEGRGISVFIANTAMWTSALAGAFFPDWDWDFGDGFHRDPLLHSYLIPYLLWIVGMIFAPYSARYLNIVSGMFALAVATHMFADCVQSDTEGLTTILKKLFDFKTSPGNIKRIPESWEHYWLFVSGVVLSACFGLTIPRIYSTHGFDWDVSNPNDPWIIALVIAGVIGAVTWIALYWYAVNLAKRKGIVQKNQRKYRSASSQKESKSELKTIEKTSLIDALEDFYPTRSDFETAVSSVLNDSENADKMIDLLIKQGKFTYKRTSPRGYYKSTQNERSNA